MKLLILPIIMVFITSISFADNLYEVDLSDDGSGLFIDMESIIHGLRGLSTVNIYEYYPNKPASRGKLKADTIIDKYEFKCKTGEARQVSELYFYNDKLIGTEKSNDVWHKANPKYGVKIMKEVCDFKME